MTMEPVPATANLESDDYYENLGVPRDATRTDIKNAYRTLAIKHHPDTNVGNAAAAEIKFKVVGEAYHVLSTPQLRSVYDESGKERLETKFTMEKARKVFQDFHRYGPEVGPNAPSAVKGIVRASGGAWEAANSGVSNGGTTLLAGAFNGVATVAVGVGGMVFNIGRGIAEFGQASALAVQKK